MGASGPLSIGIYKGIKNRQTSSQTALAEAVREALGKEVDSALLSAMVDACHQNAIETTGEAAGEDEILYFATTKARVIAQSANIRNHAAVLKKAVPECFQGEGFQAFRAAYRARREQAEGQLEMLERELADSELDLAEKAARFALWDRVSARHKGEAGYDMEAIASDPELDEAGKRQAEGMMERLGRFTSAGL